MQHVDISLSRKNLFIFWHDGAICTLIHVALIYSR